MSDDTMGRKDEAVYFSVLSLLDELPLPARKIVAMNWVKYVLIAEAAQQSPIENRVSMGVLSDLCLDFAQHVVMLPSVYMSKLKDHPPCGLCEHCLASTGKN